MTPLGLCFLIHTMGIIAALLPSTVMKVEREDIVKALGMGHRAPNVLPDIERHRCCLTFSETPPTPRLQVLPAQEVLPDV